MAVGPHKTSLPANLTALKTGDCDGVHSSRRYSPFRAIQLLIKPSFSFRLGTMSEEVTTKGAIDMPIQKSVFEVKDATPPKFEVEELHEQKYMGPERRRENRRTGHDRRLDVRFELNADDRRQSHGRREGDNGPNFW
jgi:hypothetical protein